MDKVTKDLIRKFQITTTDFMGYNLERKDVFSYHHILKKEHGGLRSKKNGAILLRNSSHNYLHIIESRDLEMYIYLNKILKEINNQNHLPSKEQILKMWDVLENFEREHSADTNREGKILIKESFTRRIIL